MEEQERQLTKPAGKTHAEIKYMTVFGQLSPLQKLKSNVHIWNNSISLRLSRYSTSSELKQHFS